MKIRILTLFVFALGALFAQCPTGTVFPGSTDTDAQLTIAVNNLSTNLNATLSPSSTSMIVTSTTGWLPYMMATVDTGANMEIVFVTAVISSTVLQISHPCEGTVAGSHLAGVPVVNNVTAYSGSTGPKSAIKAIELFLNSGGLTGTITPAPQYQVPYYSSAGTSSTVSGDAGLTYNQPSALLTATNASVGTLNISSLTGSTQCAQLDSSGNVTGTGTPCGSGGGSGTVNPGAQYTIPYYSSSGTSAVLSASSAFLIVPPSTLQVPSGITFELAGITGSTQCLSVNSSGAVGGTGAPCGSVANGAAGYVAYYSATNTVTGSSGFSYAASRLTTPNLTISALSGTQCLQEASGIVSGTGSPCGGITSETQYDVAFYTATGTVIGGSGNLTFNSSTNLLTAASIAISGLVGSTHCLEANSSGVIVSGGTACLTGVGSYEQLAFYTGTQTLTSSSLFTFSGSGGGSTLNVPNMNVTSAATIGTTATLSGGSVFLYRCVTAGALRAGVITSVPSDCGTYNSIGLITN